MTKVLIADDDKNLLTSLAIRLKAEGFDVLSAQDAYMAVAQCKKEHPDVLVLDINMPAGDGFSVQSRVDRMNHDRALPVIYLTGERSERVVQLAKARNAYAIVFKPFETSELVLKIKAAAATRR